MPNKPLSPLGYALLGLIHEDARSGYALRKVFETTPMGNYSSSPGSIYPALASLERQGLVETRGGGRGKGLFHLTPAGAAAFDTWLREPVSGKDLSTAMLRFAFLNNHPDRSLTFAFLDSFEAAASAEARGLAAFLATEFGRSMPLQSRLAVEQGRRHLESSAHWAAWARNQLNNEGDKT